MVLCHSSMFFFTEMPDSVSLKDNDPRPKITGRLYTFLCNVKNVAPIQNLTVRWFRGEELLSEMTKDQEIHEEPLNMTYTLEKYFSKEDDGKKYRCEAGLGFLSERPIQSQPVHITFHCKKLHVHLSCSLHQNAIFTLKFSTRFITVET